MIIIKISGKKYEFPHSLSEIKLSRWIEYLKFIDTEMPDAMKANEDIELDYETRYTLLDYYCKELNFWSGCPLKELRRHPLSEVFATWATLQKYLQPVEDELFKSFDCGGVTWHLPKRLMTESNLEDYAEANAYEQAYSNMLRGEYEAIFSIAAVICRSSEAEGYDDYEDEERIEFFREHLTAQDGYQIGFFLRRLSGKFTTDLEIYTTARSLGRLKQV